MINLIRRKAGNMKAKRPKDTVAERLRTFANAEYDEWHRGNFKAMLSVQDGEE